MLLDLLGETYAICRLDPGVPLPDLHGHEFLCVVRTESELSVVCPESAVSSLATADHGWRALRVAGSLPLSATGVLASLAQPLAAAGVPVFAVSTYATDYLFIPHARLDAALRALRGAGHVSAAAPILP
jgi:hypothetical protein